MHPLIRTSLIGSIQTIRTILLGMESMLKNMEQENITIKKQEHEEDPLDLQELAKVIGIVGEVDDGN